MEETQSVVEMTSHSGLQTTIISLQTDLPAVFSVQNKIKPPKMLHLHRIRYTSKCKCSLMSL